MLLLKITRTITSLSLVSWSSVWPPQVCVAFVFHSISPQINPSTKNILVQVSISQNFTNAIVHFM